MVYLTDGKRHLICYPYSEENLYEMAKLLNIKRCWFHKSKNGSKAHYDIPKKRIEEITKQCRIISTRDMINLIKGADYDL